MRKAFCHVFNLDKEVQEQLERQQRQESEAQDQQQQQQQDAGRAASVEREEPGAGPHRPEGQAAAAAVEDTAAGQPAAVATAADPQPADQQPLEQQGQESAAAAEAGAAEAGASSAPDAADKQPEQQQPQPAAAAANAATRDPRRPAPAGTPASTSAAPSATSSQQQPSTAPAPAPAPGPSSLLPPRVPSRPLPPARRRPEPPKPVVPKGTAQAARDELEEAQTRALPVDSQLRTALQAALAALERYEARVSMRLAGGRATGPDYVAVRVDEVMEWKEEGQGLPLHTEVLRQLDELLTDHRRRATRVQVRRKLQNGSWAWRAGGNEGRVCWP